MLNSFRMALHFVVLTGQFGVPKTPKQQNVLIIVDATLWLLTFLIFTDLDVVHSVISSYSYEAQGTFEQLLV